MTDSLRRRATAGVLTTLDDIGRISADVDGRARGTARLIVGSALLLGAAAAGFALFFALRPELPVDPRAHVAMVVGGAIALLVPVVLRVTGRSGLAGGMLVVDFHVILSLTPVFGDGMLDASLWWLPLSPLLGAFLLGPATGTALGALTFAQFWALVALTDAGLIAAPRVDEHSPFFIALLGSSMVAILTAIARAYARSREEAEALLAARIKELAERQRALEALSSRLAEARDAAQAREQEKAGFLRVIERSASGIEGALEEATVATSQMTAAMELIRESVESVREDATSSTDHADAVRGAASEMAAAAREMKSRVGEVARATALVTSSFAAVSTRVERAFAATRDASSEALAMAAGMEAVREAAVKTAELARVVAADAVRGTAAVERTLSGMGEIEQRSRVIAAAIRALSDEARQIARIVDVIDEVVAQTNLLALNAGIIAAQAGEEGQAFLVVADEMRKLARRTGESTAEIATSIGAMGARAKEAVAANEQGEAAIATGLARVGETAKAFAQILASAQESTRRSDDSVVEVAAQVARAVALGREMSEATELLKAATDAFTDEQRRAEGMARAALDMTTFAESVATRSERASTGGARIAEALARVRDKLHALERAHDEQSRAGTQVLHAIEEIHARQEGQVRALRELGE